jgi:hypothetical protein
LRSSRTVRLPRLTVSALIEIAAADEFTMW